MAGSAGNVQVRFQECDSTEVTAGMGASPGPRAPALTEEPLSHSDGAGSLNPGWWRCHRPGEPRERN